MHATPGKIQPWILDVCLGYLEIFWVVMECGSISDDANAWCLQWALSTHMVVIVLSFFNMIAIGL